MTITRAEIRDVTKEPLEPNAILVRRAFRTVADEMGITEENAPRYTAFITADHLREEQENGGTFYGMFLDDRQVGFVTVQREDDANWHLRRLAVLPEFRNLGLGRQLVDRVIAHVKEKGVKRLHIGIVAEQRGLKAWYEGMGFRTYRTFSVDHLPFSVALMAMRLDGGEGEDDA